MKKITAIAALLLLGSSVLAKEPEKMPSSARDALNKMDQEIEKAKNIAVVALKKSLVEETKKGNLKTAIAIQEKIDELSPSIDELNPSTSLLGKWNQAVGSSFEVKENGRIVANDGNKGKWTVSKSELTCVFPNGTYTFVLPPEDGVLSGTWSSGVSIKWTRDR